MANKRWPLAIGIGIEESDLLLVALLAISKAIYTWQPSLMAFRGYAVLAADRLVLSEIFSKRRKKYQPLNDALVMIAEETYDKGHDYSIKDDLIELMPDPVGLTAFNDLEDSTFDDAVKKLLPKLNPTEQSLLDDQLEFPFDTYKQRAERLGVKVKSIDNTMMTIRRKARLYGIYPERE